MERMIPIDIEPKSVFKFFEEISRIPRETGNEKAVSDWLVEFAKERNLSYVQDKKLNVLIRKEGTPGYEDHPGVIFQSHMDMVCEKTPGSTHDFTKDPIQIVVEGDIITAKDTTLGGDDGIGMALTLALLDADDIAHPPIEGLFTVDEELGLTGAEEFDATQLKGDYLINIDSDDDGVFVVGSAGGPTITAEIPVEYKAPSAGYKAYRAAVENLKGGHSGEDIHRQRGNADKLLFRFLDALERCGEYELASVNGGTACNAIPRDAEAIITLPAELEPEFKELAAKYDAIYKEEYKISDSDVKVSFESVDAEIDKVFTKESKDHVIDVGVFCENGILRMSMELEGVVESSNNLGIVATEEDKVLFSFCTRSFLESVYSTMVTNIDRLARSAGGRSYKEYDCLEWPYQSESHLRDLFVTKYEKLFDRPAKAIALHTGLECGMIGKNMGRKVDMISLGPECKDLHKPGEWLSISSTERYWKLFIEVLKNL